VHPVTSLVLCGNEPEMSKLVLGYELFAATEIPFKLLKGNSNKIMKKIRKINNTQYFFKNNCCNFIFLDCDYYFGIIIGQVNFCQRTSQLIPNLPKVKSQVRYALRSNF